MLLLGRRRQGRHGLGGRCLTDLARLRRRRRRHCRPTGADQHARQGFTAGLGGGHGQGIIGDVVVIAADCGQHRVLLLPHGIQRGQQGDK